MVWACSLPMRPVIPVRTSATSCCTRAFVAMAAAAVLSTCAAAVEPAGPPEASPGGAPPSVPTGTPVPKAESTPEAMPSPESPPFGERPIAPPPTTAPRSAAPAVPLVAQAASSRSAHGAVGAIPAGQTHLRIADLRRVRPGVGDVSPLDAKMDVRDADLRIPNNFGGVYQIPADAPTPYAGWFVRISGGVWAVFPQSVYRRTKQGMVDRVPPGTQYFVGGIPIDAMRVAVGASIASGGAPERIDARESSDVISEPIDGSLPMPTRVQSTLVNGRAGAEVNPVIVSSGDAESSRQAWASSTERWIADGGYRSKRLGELLAKASRPVSPAADDGR